MSSSHTQPQMTDDDIEAIVSSIPTSHSSSNNNNNGRNNETQEPPQMGSVWITAVMAVTSVDTFDVILDYIFAAGLVRRGGRKNIGYGVWLIICTTWATGVAIQGKLCLSGKTRRKLVDADDMNDVVLVTESLIFFIEDCTLVMITAVIDDAFDATNATDVLAVTMSLASACITIFTYSRFIWEYVMHGEFWAAAILLHGLASSCLFGYLLLRLLVESGLSDDLGLGHRIGAWILYVSQMVLVPFLWQGIFE